MTVFLAPGGDRELRRTVLEFPTTALMLVEDGRRRFRVQRQLELHAAAGLIGLADGDNECDVGRFGDWCPRSGR